MVIIVNMRVPLLIAVAHQIFLHQVIRMETEVAEEKEGLAMAPPIFVLIQ